MANHCLHFRNYNNGTAHHNVCYDPIYAGYEEGDYTLAGTTDSNSYAISMYDLTLSDNSIFTKNETVQVPTFADAQGSTSLTLTSGAIAPGRYQFTFCETNCAIPAQTEVRNVFVAYGGTAVSWTGALESGTAVTTANYTAPHQTLVATITGYQATQTFNISSTVTGGPVLPGDIIYCAGGITEDIVNGFGTYLYSASSLTPATGSLTMRGSGTFGSSGSPVNCSVYRFLQTYLVEENVPAGGSNVSGGPSDYHIRGDFGATLGGYIGLSTFSNGGLIEGTHYGSSPLTQGGSIYSIYDAGVHNRIINNEADNSMVAGIYEDGGYWGLRGNLCNLGVGQDNFSDCIEVGTSYVTNPTGKILDQRVKGWNNSLRYANDARGMNGVFLVNINADPFVDTYVVNTQIWPGAYGILNVVNRWIKQQQFDRANVALYTGFVSPSVMVPLQDTDGSSTILGMVSSQAASLFYCERVEGTIVSPAATAATGATCKVAAGGYDSAAAIHDAADLYFQATATWTTSTHEMATYISATPPNSLTKQIEATFQNGVVLGAASLGAQGRGTLNATDVYINGVDIPSTYAPLASPTFTGTPAAPTPSTSDSSTKLATTAFVKNQNYTSVPLPVSVANGGTGLATITAHGVMIGEGTGNVTPTAAGASATLLLGQGASADPTFNAMSGDATISSAGVITIGAAAITVSKMANMAANTILSNWTAGSAAPVANVWPSCASGSALGYINGTGLVCNGSYALLSANTFTATQTINPAANTSGLIISGGSITGSGTTVPGITVAGTLNTTGIVDGAAVFANITNTACASVTTCFLLDYQVGGVSEFKVDLSGDGTFTKNVTAGGTSQYNWTARGIITSPAAQQVQLGAANAASPLSQTVLTQGSRGGTDSNVAGGNLTIQSGLGTGNATGSTLALQTPHAGSTGTSAQTANTQIQLGDNTVSMPNLASSSSATTGTVCWTTGGNLTVDTTLACLSSDKRLKKNIIPFTNGLKEVLAFKPYSYDLKFDPKHEGRQVGLMAQDVEKIDPRLVSLYDTGPDKGQPEGVRYMQLTAVLVQAIKEQQAEIAALTKEVARLKNSAEKMNYRVITSNVTHH